MKVLLLFVLAAFRGAGAAPKPKMLSKAADPSKPLGPSDETTTLSSAFAISLGECVHGVPFQVELFGSAGRGVIGVEAPASDKEINIAFVSKDAPGNVAITGAAEPNFFALESIPTEDFHTIPFDYTIASTSQSLFAEITCSKATQLILIIRDESDFEVQANVKEVSDGDELELVGVESVEPLKGRTRAKKGQSESPVSFDQATNKKIKVRHQPGNPNKGLAIVDAKISTPNGKTVVRSFIQESKAKKNNGAGFIPVKCCDINEDGDVELEFPNLSAKDVFYKVDARIGLSTSASSEREPLVDVTAMLTENGKMIVHGGWIRRALAQERGLEGNESGWDIHLIEAVVSSTLR